MIAIKVLFLLWMALGLNCRNTNRKQRLCRQAGQILDNGSFTSLNERKRKYVCRSEFVSNIPDLEKLPFMCKFERKSDSYEWRAKLTSDDYLYLRNVTCQQKKKCSDPPLPSNMTREITTRYLISISNSNEREAGNDFYTGDTLKYSCKPGFILLSDLETSSFFNEDDFGDYNNKDDKLPQLSTTAAPVTVSVFTEITCDADGLWNGFPDSQMYFGECQAIQCNASVFADISDGNISNFKETYEFLDEIKLECKDGYQHKGGVKSALCMTPSSFSNLFLTGFGCERIKCIKLESPGNGYLRIDHNYVNGTVNYECESGYDLIGYPVWKCQSNGEWDHDCVKCAHKDAYCPPPCLPPGAITKTSSGRYQMGDVLEFTCKSGKYYGGSTNRTCMKNRYWSGTPIDCTGTSLVDLSVGIELVSAMKQISQNRTKSDTPISKTINVWNRKGVDMYLLVDISKVETPEKLNETLSFVYALLPELGINDGDTGTRLVLTFFGSKPYRMFERHINEDDWEGPFKSYKDVIKELELYNNKNELHFIKNKTDDGTNITAALKDTYELIKTTRESSHRYSQQVLIVISDGRLTTTDDPTKLANKLKESFFVEIYSIAIGDLTDTKAIETMKNLASDIKNEQHFFKISNEESKFKQVLSSMINKGCEEEELTNANLKQLDPCETDLDTEIAVDSMKQEEDHITSFQTKSTPSKEHIQLAKAMTISIAYAANIGGTTTITGCASNIILKGLADEIFHERGLTSPISFGTWLVLGFPVSLLIFFALFLWLTLYFRGCSCFKKKKDNTEGIRDFVKKEYKALGPVTFPEVMVIVLFVILVILWVSRDLGGAGGWGNLFKKKYVTDSAAPTLVSALLFLIPANLPDFFKSKNRPLSVKPLLTWRVVHDKVPWGLFLLFGGGFALAQGCKESGLSESIREALTVFQDLPVWVTSLLVALLTSFITEVVTNTATCTLVLPIIAQLALGIGVNPLYLMIPTAVATSYAFMLPVATPPNAMVYVLGYFSMSEMIRAGCIMNILSVLILTLGVNTWGAEYFSLRTLPVEFSDLELTTIMSFNSSVTMAT